MTMDWQHGAGRLEFAGSPVDHRVIIVGDWAPIRRYGDLMQGDPASVYGDLLPVLRDSDLRIVNLEAPLCAGGTGASLEDGRIAKDGPNLRGAPQAIRALATVPFDVACLANNHSMDYGPAALRETQTRLACHAIDTVGAGLSREEALAPLVRRVGETVLGIVNFCEGEDGTSALAGPGVFGWEIPTVLETVATLRARVDVLIVIAHVGREYAPAPPPYVQATFRAIARAGADLVVGHHPHVPQGIEFFEGVPLVYSLGNFIFYQNPRSIYQRLGYLLSVALADRRMVGFDLHPYALNENGARLLRGRQKALFLQRLRAVSEFLESPAKVREVWHAFIDSFGEAFWLEQGGGLFDLMAGMQEDFAGIAPKVRNRFITPAHQHFIGDGLGRAIARKIGAAEPWAVALVEEWRTLQEIGGY
jgi:poly-gamma-glutamate synthesis protein (capsule biosynthesis protein)